MAYIKQAIECDCHTCKGSESTPGVYGGWFCLCRCHRKTKFDNELDSSQLEIDLSKLVEIKYSTEK